MDWIFKMRSLGLDVGDRRIGIAISDPMGMLARPLKVMERQEDQIDINNILQIVADLQAGIIIVGLPRSMDGSYGTQSVKVQEFGEKLKTAAPVGVEYRDERLTTVSAKNLLEARGKKKTRYVPKGEYDAAAAAVILQSYLNEIHPVTYPEVPSEE
jgi:putative Holliday junction resolvase